MTTWSYSSIKTFDQCPKKYYHLKIAKDVKDVAGPEADYGTEAHSAAEEFIKTGAPVPSKFTYMQGLLDSLAAIPGEKHTELRLGIKLTDDGYAPCGFFDKDVWWRGIADLVIINGTKARSIDYKTGKSARYADLTQLDMIAAALFLHFPELTEIKSALAYVVSGDFLPKKHEIEKHNTYLRTFDTSLHRLEKAVETGVWNANSSPLCGWCPVTSCEHHYVPRRR